MTTRINLQTCYVLHTRPFQDHSLLVDLFSRQYGRVRVIAPAVRNNRSKQRNNLQPFTPLLASWSGNTELMTLGKVESNQLPFQLTGHALLSGFYLNELLVRLLPCQDPYQQLYLVYEQTLDQLQYKGQQQLALRFFEKQLLSELGYGLVLNKDVHGQTISAEAWYRFDHEHGLVKITEAKDSLFLFRGATLLALQEGRFADFEQLRQAKHFMRLALAPLLGNKPLKSRELFIS